MKKLILCLALSAFAMASVQAGGEKCAAQAKSAKSAKSDCCSAQKQSVAQKNGTAKGAHRPS